MCYHGMVGEPVSIPGLLRCITERDKRRSGTNEGTGQTKERDERRSGTNEGAGLVLKVSSKVEPS